MGKFFVISFCEFFFEVVDGMEDCGVFGYEFVVWFGEGFGFKFFGVDFVEIIIGDRRGV